MFSLACCGLKWVSVLQDFWIIASTRLQSWVYWSWFRWWHPQSDRAHISSQDVICFHFHELLLKIYYISSTAPCPGGKGWPRLFPDSQPLGPRWSPYALWPSWGLSEGFRAKRLDSQRSPFPAVLRASYECEKEALTHSFQEAKAALQVKGAGPCWSLCRWEGLGHAGRTCSEAAWSPRSHSWWPLPRREGQSWLSAVYPGSMRWGLRLRGLGLRWD